MRTAEKRKRQMREKSALPKKIVTMMMKNVFLPPLGNNLIRFNTIPSSFSKLADEKRRWKKMWLNRFSIEFLRVLGFSFLSGGGVRVLELNMHAVADKSLKGE